MRIRGDISPDAFTINTHGADYDKVEVRVRENVRPYEDADSNGYEYDEYLFVLKRKEGLEESVERNLDEWVETGRNLEIDSRASLFVTARADAVDEYTEELIMGGII